MARNSTGIGLKGSSTIPPCDGRDTMKIAWFKHSMVYHNCMLFEEIYNFYQKASEEDAKLMDGYMQSKEYFKVLDLLEKVLGIDLSMLRSEWQSSDPVSASLVSHNSIFTNKCRKARPVPAGIRINWNKPNHT